MEYSRESLEKDKNYKREYMNNQIKGKQHKFMMKILKI